MASSLQVGGQTPGVGIAFLLFRLSRKEWVSVSVNLPAAASVHVQSSSIPISLILPVLGS